MQAPDLADAEQGEQPRSDAPLSRFGGVRRRIEQQAHRRSRQQQSARHERGHGEAHAAQIERLEHVDAGAAERDEADQPERGDAGPADGGHPAQVRLRDAADGQHADQPAAVMLDDAAATRRRFRGAGRAGGRDPDGCRQGPGPLDILSGSVSWRHVCLIRLCGPGPDQDRRATSC